MRAGRSRDDSFARPWRVPGAGAGRREIVRLLADVGDEELKRAIRDLGGHDLVRLLEAFAAADAVTDRPTVIFAYTIKAWNLPTEGHPGNHSALLTDEQWLSLARELDADPEQPWAGFGDETPELEICRQAARRLERDPIGAIAPGSLATIFSTAVHAATFCSSASGSILSRVSSGVWCRSK